MSSSGFTSREHASRGLLGRLGQAGPRPGKQEHVLAHLQALLGTRLGESLSTPGMGLTDFADIVHGYPASMQVLVHAIRTMLSQYEPRLRAITVTPAASDDPLTLALEISARFDDTGSAVHMRTELTASGRIHVSGG